MRAFPDVPVLVRRALPAAELGLALAAAIGATAGAHALVVALGLDATDRLAAGIGPVWAAAMVAVAVAAHVVERRVRRPARARLAVAPLAGLAAGLAGAPLMAGLLHTAQPPYGVLAGDMAFRAEYVTRFAATWHLADYTFRGLDAFYPPAWFWLAGRIADLAGAVPWHVLKPFTILTLGAALLVAYALWRLVLTPAGAASAAIGSSLLLTTQVPHVERIATQGWYSPYSCFVAVTGAAWLAGALATAGARRAHGRLAVVTLVGAVLALTYYLLFALLVVVMLALAAFPAAGRRSRLLRAGAMCGGVALLTAVFWVPLAAAVVRGAAAQGHFVRPDFLGVSTGLGGPPALGVLAFVAIALLALTIAAPASRAVAGVLAGTALYQLGSVASLVVAHDQWQPHRAATMMAAAFGAAVPVALDALRSGGTVLDLLAPPVRRALVVAALALTVPAVFALGARQGTDEASGSLTKAAHRPLQLATTDVLSRFITRESGRAPQQLTVLSADHALLVTRPYFGFLPLRARYAHPEADVPGRVSVVARAAACRDPACTTRALEGSRFGPVDALVLTRVPSGYRVTTEEDGFPGPRVVPITFRRAAFAPAAWSRRDVGVFTAFVRRQPGYSVPNSRSPASPSPGRM